MSIYPIRFSKAIANSPHPPLGLFPIAFPRIFSPHSMSVVANIHAPLQHDHRFHHPRPLLASALLHGFQLPRNEWRVPLAQPATNLEENGAPPAKPKTIPFLDGVLVPSLIQPTPATTPLLGASPRLISTCAVL